MTKYEFRANQKLLGLNAPQMADKLDCSVSLIEKLRTGKKSVSRKISLKLENLVRIAK